MHYTKQEMFDLSVTGVVNQGGPSFSVPNPTGRKTCSYRGENGRKCGIGHLIKDEDYTRSMDGGLTVSVLVNNKRLPEYIPQTTDEDMSFITELQQIHDHMQKDTDLGEYIISMKEIAVSNDLTMPELEN